MDVETENQRLRDAYRAMLGEYEACVKFWQANPIVLSAEEFVAARFATPDETCREAMAALDRWRAFRFEHDMP